MRKLTENSIAILNISSTALVAGINFLTIPIFTRLLDTDGYGVVNIYTAWVQIFTVVIGFKADGSVGSAKANLRDEEQDSYHLSVLAMSFCFFAFVFSAAMLFLNAVSSLLGMDPILTICMLVQSFAAFVISVFNNRFIFKKQAQKNFAMSVGVCLATTLLSVFLILAVFTQNGGYLGRVFGLTIPNVAIAIGLILSLVLSGKAMIRLRYWKFCLVLTLPLVLHGLSQVLLSQTGKIAIQQSYGDSLAGVYSVAVVVSGLLHAIYTALNNSFVPFMYDDLAGKTSSEVKQSHFRNYFTSFTLGTCSFALVSPEILKIMSTEAYWSAISILPILTIGQYCVFLYSFPVNYEFFKMKTRSVAVGTVMAALLNVVLNYVLVPSIGMVGAALSAMAAYLSLFVFHFFTARFSLNDRNYPARFFAFGLGGVISMCVACYVLMDIAAARWAIAIAFLVMVGVRIAKTRSVF